MVNIVLIICLALLSRSVLREPRSPWWSGTSRRKSSSTSSSCSPDSVLPLRCRAYAPDRWCESRGHVRWLSDWWNGQGSGIVLCTDRSVCRAHPCWGRRSLRPPHFIKRIPEFQIDLEHEGGMTDNEIIFVFTNILIVSWSISSFPRAPVECAPLLQDEGVLFESMFDLEVKWRSPINL